MHLSTQNWKQIEVERGVVERSSGGRGVGGVVLCLVLMLFVVFMCAIMIYMYYSCPFVQCMVLCLCWSEKLILTYPPFFLLFYSPFPLPLYFTFYLSTCFCCLFISPFIFTSFSYCSSSFLVFPSLLIIFLFLYSFFLFLPLSLFLIVFSPFLAHPFSSPLFPFYFLSPFLLYSFLFSNLILPYPPLLFFTLAEHKRAY